MSLRILTCRSPKFRRSSDGNVKYQIDNVFRTLGIEFWKVLLTQKSSSLSPALLINWKNTPGDFLLFEDNEFGKKPFNPEGSIRSRAHYLGTISEWEGQHFGLSWPRRSQLPPLRPCPKGMSAGLQEFVPYTSLAEDTTPTNQSGSKRHPPLKGC